MRDSADTDSISLLSNVPLTRRLSVFLSLGSANQGNGRKPQLFAAFQSNQTQSDALNPMKIIQSTLSSAGILTSNG